jgi:hypothetical protein
MKIKYFTIILFSLFFILILSLNLAGALPENSIIGITDAKHLDSYREFLSDIYEQAKDLDNFWSETINHNEYVRVTFSSNLTTDNDITLYPRIISGTPIIEVYEINGTTKIAEFTNIKSNEYNKIYLTNLIGEQDTFDLKVVGGSIEFDYILDPPWWNSSWLYKIPINLSVTSGSTPQNYQVELIINSSNNGTNWDWTNECVNSNSSRVRFVNGSENTELDFWIKSCSISGKNMTAWVEVDNNITTTAYTIYMYYGNPSANSQSNGTATFDFFDDFSGDLSKWHRHIITGVYPQIENGYLVSGGGITSGNYGHTVLGSNTTYNSFLNGIIEFKHNHAASSIGEVSFRGNYAGNTGYKGRWDARSGSEQVFLKPPYSGWGNLGTAVTKWITAGVWYEGKLVVNGSNMTFYDNGVFKQSLIDTSFSAAGEISLQNHYGSYTQYDDVRVRKYASPEPTYLVGGEVLGEVLDSCTCAGLNSNWEIDMSDYCNITSTCDLGTGNITWIGAGETRFDATISLRNLQPPSTGQTLYIKSQAVINVG